MKDLYYKPQEYLQESMDLFSDKTDRTSDDLLLQHDVKLGISLSLKNETFDSGKNLYKLQISIYASLIVILMRYLSKIEEEPMRIVFKD